MTQTQVFRGYGLDQAVLGQKLLRFCFCDYLLGFTNTDVVRIFAKQYSAIIVYCFLYQNSESS